MYVYKYLGLTRTCSSSSQAASRAAYVSPPVRQSWVNPRVCVLGSELDNLYRTRSTQDKFSLASKRECAFPHLLQLQLWHAQRTRMGLGLTHGSKLAEKETESESSFSFLRRPRAGECLRRHRLGLTHPLPPQST